MSRKTIKTDKLRHTTEAMPAVAATCTETGLMEGTRCRVCGEFIFTDVTGNKSIEYVSWAYENGIVKGTGTNSFSPNDSCTRLELVIFLYKYNRIYKLV